MLKKCKILIRKIEEKEKRNLYSHNNVNLILNGRNIKLPHHIIQKFQNEDFSTTLVMMIQVGIKIPCKFITFVDSTSLDALYNAKLC